MSVVHLHLLTAHLPILGIPVALALLLAGLARQSEALWRAGCWAVVISGMLAFLPYFSGPPAYEFLMSRAIIGREPVEQHAIVARGAFLGLIVLGVVSLSSLLRDWQGDPPGKVLRGLILAGAFAVAYALAWAGHLGGLIRRPDLAETPLRLFP
jgi:uncharacterized membrane protein